VGVGATASSGSAATQARKVVDRGPAAATAKRERGSARGRVDLAMVLGWRHSHALSALDQAVSDPSSPRYAHYVSTAQFRKRFSPTPREVASVQRFLRARGFRIGSVSKARMLV